MHPKKPIKGGTKGNLLYYAKNLMTSKPIRALITTVRTEDKLLLLNVNSIHNHKNSY